MTTEHIVGALYIRIVQMQEELETKDKKIQDLQTVIHNLEVQSQNGTREASTEVAFGK